MIFHIVGSNGDRAEADTLDAARMAARTFVEDGNELAAIYPGEDTYPVTTAWKDEHGAIVLNESTLTRKYANGPAEGLQCRP